MKIKINNKSPEGRLFEITTWLYNEAQTSVLLDIEAARKIIPTLPNIDRYGIIIHDSDTYTEGDIAGVVARREKELKLLLKKNYIPDENDEVDITPEEYKKIEEEISKRIPLPVKGAKKHEHVHIVLEFSKKIRISRVAKFFNIPDFMVQRYDISRSQKFEDVSDSRFRYLTHFDDKDKFPYNYSDVECNFNYDNFIRHYEIKKETRGKNKLTAHELEDLLLLVSSEGLTKKQIIDKTSPIVWVDYEKKFLKAQQIFFENADYKRKKPRECVYIYGASGTGKSYTVLNDYLKEYSHHDVYIGAAFHGFDEYGQEPVVFLDEFEGYMSAADIKKICDTNINNKASARFRNVRVTADYIYICSNIAPDELFKSEIKDTLTGKYDSYDGIMRRFSFVRFDSDLTITSQYYDLEKHALVNIKTYEHPHKKEIASFRHNTIGKDILADKGYIVYNGDLYSRNNKKLTPEQVSAIDAMEKELLDRIARRKASGDERLTDYKLPDYYDPELPY